MADNSSIPVASGNETFANKDIGGVKHPKHIIVDSTGTEVGHATAANQATGNTSLATIATNTTGAATAANQTTGNTSLGTIATNTTGVATAANQATGNTSLATIATNTTGAATAANQTTGNTSIAAVSTTLGAKTDAKSTATDGTSVSAMQVLKQISASMQDAVSDPFSDYEVVAASQTDAVIGATGAVDDYLAAIWIFPATADCDGVTIKDGATTIYTFPGGGTTALPSLAPIPWMPGIKAKNAGFSVTTGANVAVMGVGAFT